MARSSRRSCAPWPCWATRTPRRTSQARPQPLPARPSSMPSWHTCRDSGGTRRKDADMDWGIAVGVVTGVLLVAFLGIVAWAWSRKRKKDFDEAARYPLFDEGDRL